MKARVVAVVVLGLVAVVLAWNALFFAPAGRDVDAARQRRDAAVTEQAQLAAELRSLQEIGTQGPAWRAKVAKLNAMVPRTPELDAFIRSAYTLKVSSGVDWVSIQPSEPAAPTSGTGPTEISMQIVVNGGYFQVLDYLDRLEGLRRIVVVDSVDVAAGSDAGAGSGAAASSSGAPQLAVTLAARMFTQAAPVVAGTGTPNAPGATTTTAPGPTTTVGTGATTTTAAVG